MDEIDKILQETEITVNGDAVKFETTDVVEDTDGNGNAVKFQETPVPISDDEVNIDDLINEIAVTDDVFGNGKDDEETELTLSNEFDIDFDEKHSLAKRISENSLDVIKNAKEVFTGFKSDVLFGKDRSTSSKEMLIKSLEVQNQANKNLIDLAKVLDKDSGGNTNILIASQVSAKKTGVDPVNIKSHFKK